MTTRTKVLEFQPTAPAPPLSGAGTARFYVDPGTGLVFVSQNGGAYAALPVGGACLYDAYASRPAAGAVGRRFVASDGAIAFVDTGAKWRADLDGFVIDQIPAVASWAAAIGTGVTWSDATAPGTVTGSLPAAGADTRLNALIESYTAPPPTITRTLAFEVLTQSADANLGSTDSGSGAGVAFYASGSGELMVFSYHLDNNDLSVPVTGYLSIRKWTDPTTKTPATLLQYAMKPKAIRVTDDGTDYTFQVSPDGRTFYTFHTMTRLAGTDGVGPCIQRSSAAAIPVVASFRGWE